MPLYDYECLGCGHTFELRQSFKDDPVGICPSCKGHARRKFHAVPIIYKGSGFYTTDYGRSSVSANGVGATSSDEEKKGATAEPATSKTSSSSKEEPSAAGAKPSSTGKTKSSKAAASSSKTEG